MNSCSYGFRIVGDCTGERRLVDAGAALRGYAACDERAEVNRESYLSAFTFGYDFRVHLETTGSTRGFSGTCWAPWIWFDIDRADLDAALADARRFAAVVDERYRLGDDDLLVFFSGSKGFHLGVPTSLWTPEPSDTFHRVARRFAESTAERCGVSIDSGVYDRVRAFRAPNSKHPKTGRHKRRLSFTELMELSLDGILQLAATAEPFELAEPRGRSAEASIDWQSAMQAVERAAAVKAQRQAAQNAAPTLNRLTLEFIREGATEGDRHRLLFSAAANLAEFGCPPDLAHALLSESALDSGLLPKEVHRQIECGLKAAGAVPLTEGITTETLPAAPTETRPANSAALREQLAQHWRQAPAVGSPVPDSDGHGDAWEPPEDRPKGIPAPAPPAGAQLYFQDARCRPCPPAEAAMWTWSGAPRWFHVADWPIPSLLSAGGAA